MIVSGLRSLLLLGISSAALTFAGAACAAGAAPLPPPADQALAHDLLKEMIETNSTHAHGSTALSEKIARRLLDAGFAPADVQVVVPPDHPTKGNVVVRLHGKGLGKPILYIGHLDVVEAKREDWTVDPFVLTEKDGWFYGRGVVDMKGEDVAVLESLIRLKREGFKPDRDIIVAFTADEEAEGDANGVDFLLSQHRDLVDAGLVLNPDAGGGAFKGGQRIGYGVQTSEKLYVTYSLETTNRGGHSSEPRPDNAIYELAQALVKLSAYRFPVHMTDTTRLFFGRTSAAAAGDVRADMLAVSKNPPDLAAAERLSAEDVNDNAMLRTTCVATMEQGGHAENALPQRAQATIQCRLIPGETVEDTKARLAQAIGDPGVKVSLAVPVKPSGESKLTPEIMARYEKTVHGMWPGVPVIPTMDPGASDSVHSRAAGIPSFGASAIFNDIDDIRIHGRDERVTPTTFYEGVEFAYRLMKAMSAK
jgi:acetylornithine deacetylase/succinyl-diaminopimelate desuccinylase-like protein